MNDSVLSYQGLLKIHLDRIGNLSAQITGELIKDGAHIKNKEEDKKKALYWAVDTLEAIIQEKYKQEFKYEDKKAKIKEGDMYDRYMAKLNLLVGLIDFKGWLFYEDILTKVRKGKYNTIEEEYEL